MRRLVRRLVDRLRLIRREELDARIAGLAREAAARTDALRRGAEERIAAVEAGLGGIRDATVPKDSLDPSVRGIVTSEALLRVDAEQHPRAGLGSVLREDAMARWNTKVLGAALAESFYKAGIAGPRVPIPEAPIRVGLTSGLCRQADIEQPWLHYWCRHAHRVPFYHRKIWEDAFVLQALWEADMMRPGRRGLGFAVGREPLPAIFVEFGAEILATDLPVEEAGAADWKNSGQHADSLGGLFRGTLVSEAEFRARCTFRPMNMNAIPDDLRGAFDFCWSVCSLEHLGSIELGLRFVVESLRCLKPGGVAVHTTEYNFDPTETIDNWGTVLFQRRHIEELVARVAAAGGTVAPIDFDPGGGVLDQFVDVPPFEHQYRGELRLPAAPHLRISIDGFPATSIALIIRKNAARA